MIFSKGSAMISSTFSSLRSRDLFIELISRGVMKLGITAEVGGASLSEAKSTEAAPKEIIFNLRKNEVA